jgi:mRNA interferase RelE/StbE
MARVDLFPEAVEDIAELDNSAREHVFKGLRKLEVEPAKRGAPLGSGLTTFRKLVVGNRQIRIVYRVEADGNVAVVWVVASRVDSECYNLAMGRLALHAAGESKTALEELVHDVFEDQATPQLPDSR